jgi:hypothetical protein
LTNKFFRGLFVCMLALSTVAFADTVSSTTGTAQWVANTGPVATGGIPPATTGTFFWDNASYDANVPGPPGKCNVGYFLNGTQTGCSAATQYNNIGAPPGNLNFLAANATGSADVANMTFTGVGDTATFRAAFTFNNGVASAFPDVFGWFNTATPGVLNPLFSTANTAVNTATFTPTGSFGYYLQNGATIYRSTTEGQQFALFAAGAAGVPPTNLGTYWLGVEDARNELFKYTLANGDYDYQDMIIKIEAVPEPAYVALLLAGFAGLAFFARRRQGVV